MSQLTHLKIKYKLTLMLFLPLSGLLFLSFITVLNEARVVNNIEVLEEVVDISIQIANIMHSIQAERELSELQGLAVTTSEPWQQQVAATDTQITAFIHANKGVHFEHHMHHHSDKFYQDIDNIITTLQQVSAIRNQPDKLAAYNQINDKLSRLVNEIVSEHMHEEFVKPMLAFLNVLITREKAAQEKVLLAVVIRQTRFTSAQFQKFVDLISQQNLYINATLRRYMDSMAQAHAETLLQSEDMQAVEQLRQVAYNSNVNAPLPDTVTDTNGQVQAFASYWEEAQDRKIHLLRTLEKYLTQNLLDHINRVEANALTNFTLIILGTGLATLIAFSMAYLTTTNLSRRLQQLVEAAQRVAAGDLNRPLESEARDEIGQLLNTFATMQQQLRAQIEAEKAVTEEALRVKQALDTVNTSVIISDNDYQIIYVNQAALALFEQYAVFMQTELPHLDPAQLILQKLDVLHKDPSEYREHFEHLTAPKRMSLNLEHVMLEYDVNPVLNTQGERIGFVQEFHDLTEETAIEEEISTVIYLASQGEFSRHINLEGKTGFFKTFSKSVNHILSYNQQSVQDMSQIFSALAQGNLSQTIGTAYKGMLEQLKQDANKTVQQLTSVMLTIRDSADKVQKAADEIGQGHFSLTQRTEQQASALQQTAASMEQMTGTVQQNAENAREAKALAMTANSQAEEGREIVNEAVNAMSRINDSSQQIADIIGVIDDIAFQTNLLALNAAVEAARAGEHGRGFSVVATEVRNLAQRSATAAKEIKQLIRSSMERVEEGTIFVEQSDQALLEIVKAVKKVSDIVADIAAASVEQAAGIQQVNKVIMQMDSMTQQNAALVEETTSAGELLLNQAKRLRKQVAFFHLAE